jgi:PhnB protein
MPKRSSAEQLDQAIESMLISRRMRPEQYRGPGLGQMMAVAQILCELPRPDFKESLKLDLQRKASMKEPIAPPAAPPATTASFVRPGFNNIAPYILVKGAARFIDFLKSAFEGTERIRVPRPDGSIMHAEIGIGNSVIELGDANDQNPPRPATVHLYVDNADSTYARALQAGATSVYPVADQFWGDRQGCVKDMFGNVWYIAMPNGWDPGPEGLRSVQPFLHLRDAHNMIPFVEAAFGAEVLGIAKSPEGKLLHSTVKIGIATLEINEAHGEFQPAPCYLHVYVPDTDTLYAQALRAGATAVEPPANKPYGDRSATVKDPFGNTWFLATYLGHVGM